MKIDRKKFPLENANGTVIICPGGAYRSLSEREAGPVAEAFRSAGWSAEVLYYTVRTTEEQPVLGLVPVHQLSEAVAEVRREQPGKPVIVCGFSAGAHLAATLGVHWADLALQRPDAMILSYPVITAKEGFLNEESFRNLTGNENRAYFSLEEHVSGNTPPAFLWHTAADTSVPVENSLFFSRALSREKIPFELHIYPNGVHGLSLATPEVEQPEKNRCPDPHVAGWFPACAEWLAGLKL